MRLILYPILAAVVCSGVLFAVADQPATGPRDDSAAEGLGWKLATQAWTFRDRTAIEAIATAERLGLKYIELYPGQDLGKDFPGAKVGPDLSAELRNELKKLLVFHNVKLMNFGVVNFKNDETSVRRVFEFARDMGIETITCEPEMAAWDLVERLADEFKINAACHDHPKPTPYWNPDTVLEVIKGRSKHLGACADTGHWTRSGLVPVDCLKKLEGRIISLHFKDIAPVGLRGTDRPWGTGEGNARGILEELHRQGFKGVVAVEYESGSGPELEANVAKCIIWFDSVARELAAKR
jgi:sugar phosphate isomerase/epimerase